MIQTMTQTVESKVPHFPAGHKKRVTNLACCIAEEMGLSRNRIADVRLFSFREKGVTFEHEYYSASTSFKEGLTKGRF